MWILDLIPTWIWTLLLTAGCSALLAARVLKFIPVISLYKLPIQIGGILAIIVSIWFLGSASNEEKWQARVKEVEAKLAKAEAKSQEENIKIITKVVKKLELVRTRGEDVIKYIDREVVKDKEVIKFVENCPIPQVIINTHNAAALNKPIEANE